MFEQVGVQLVGNVEPYEQMKLRLLNASHQALGYLGYLAGYRMVGDVARDPLFERFVHAYMDDEATPTLAPVPGIDLDSYQAELLERFTNVAVGDTLERLCAETSDRIPKFLLPVIRHNLAHDGQIELATAVVAAWARYAEGVDEDGEPINVVDRLSESLTDAAKRQSSDPLAFVADREIFGDLVDNEAFTSSYTSTLDSLHSVGARETLEHLLAQKGSS